jgi:hypothetical protein
MDDIIIEPMTQDFLVWRCLHHGPLSPAEMDRWPSGSPLPWDQYKTRNVTLLANLTRTYGACAILGREGHRIVGLLRFYPGAVWNMEGAGGLCLQQDYPSGPRNDFAVSDFPPLSRIQDRTLRVHCLMTGSSQKRENPFQRKGIGSKMAACLIRWAAAGGWNRIEADAFEELPIIYETTGCTGHAFWEKLGFTVADRYPHPDLQAGSLSSNDPETMDPFVRTLETQAVAAGIPPGRAKDKIVMSLNLPVTVMR